MTPGRKRRPAARVAAAAAAWLFLCAGALAQQQEAPDDGSQTLPDPILVLPKASEAVSEVVLFSGADGWGETEAALAERLKAKGVITLGIDLPAYLARLATIEDECLYLVSDIEAVSHRIQRDLGNDDYEAPVVAGIGAGAALALAIAAQTPEATIEATVAVDPLPAIAVKTPLCTPAERQETEAGAVYALTPGPLPNPVTVVLSPDAPDTGRAHATRLEMRWPEIAIENTRLSALDALERALTPVAGPAQDAESTVARLPLAILEAEGEGDGRMAIIYSGDGGWRDIDRQIGGELQAAGMPTVGVDALRYFWSERTPQKAAADLSAIIDTYSKRWNSPHIVLVGYSFGADALPAIVAALDPAHRAMISQLSLLALSPQASFQISVAGWLGVQAGGRSTLDDLAGFDAARIQCFYGREEAQDSACPALAARGAEIVTTNGGHHFDGNYPALAQDILRGPRPGTTTR